MCKLFFLYLITLCYVEKTKHYNTFLIGLIQTCNTNMPEPLNHKLNEKKSETYFLYYHLVQIAFRKANVNYG